MQTRSHNEKDHRGLFRPEDRLLSLKQVREIVLISKTSIYELMARTPPEFPLPLKLSSQKRAWIYREVIEWIDNKMKERNERIRANFNYNRKETE